MIPFFILIYHCIVFENSLTSTFQGFRLETLNTPFNLQEIARHLRPRTLRAKFGKSKIQNAVHCTDLPEDAALEVLFYAPFIFSLQN